MGADEVWNRIIEMAGRYDWSPEFPNIMEQLRARTIPEGFCREVGKTISLFMERPIMSLGTPEKNIAEYEASRKVGNHLAELRYLLAVARINIKESWDHEAIP